jgi:glycosyltransferase involved in cell wall biosynthesis
MKVSIITPCLNGERYLKATLDSIYAQTYVDFEHIVVDGGSTDSSHAIIGSFPKTKLVVATDNGMYEAINRGFAMASGEVFAYLNADDLYLPKSLEQAIAVLKQGNDLVYGDLDLIDEHGRIQYTRKYLSYHPTLFQSVDYSTIPQPASFWKASLYKRVGAFDTAFKLAGDFDFFLRACLSPSRVAHVSRPLAQFRIHPDALSQKALDRMRTEVGQILDKHHIVQNLNRKLVGMVYQSGLRALNLPGMLWQSAARNKKDIP